MAGARKGKGEGKTGRARNAQSEGEGKHLQPAHCLFHLAPSLIICKLLSACQISAYENITYFSQEPGAREKIERLRRNIAGILRSLTL